MEIVESKCMLQDRVHDPIGRGGHGYKRVPTTDIQQRFYFPTKEHADWKKYVTQSSLIAEKGEIYTTFLSRYLFQSDVGSLWLKALQLAILGILV